MSVNVGGQLNLEKSETGHYVIDLISRCAGAITDESTRENASGSGKRSRDESGPIRGTDVAWCTVASDS